MRPLFLPVLILVAVIGVRLLGVRLGWWRAVLVAWLGLATAGIFLTALNRANNGRLPPLLLVVGVGLLAMMAWAGVFELLSSSLPEPARQSLTNPIKTLRGQLARGRRRTEIVAIASRSGLARFGRRHSPEPQGSATGRSLRTALEQAGGVYVKLGQFLSTRPDLLPPRSSPNSAVSNRRSRRSHSRWSTGSSSRSCASHPPPASPHSTPPRPQPPRSRRSIGLSYSTADAWP
jgi:ubiquinone biosynthesis protein